MTCLFTLLYTSVNFNFNGLHASTLGRVNSNGSLVLFHFPYTSGDYCMYGMCTMFVEKHPAWKTCMRG